MTAKTVFHDLPLLLHSVCGERFARIRGVAIRTGPDVRLAMEQVPSLDHRSATEVGQSTPGLILGAVGHFMGQYRQVAFAAQREKYVITKRDRSIAAEPEDKIAQQASNPRSTTSIEPHPPAIHGPGEASQRSMFVGGQAFGWHIKLDKLNHESAKENFVVYRPRNSPIGASASM
jgi:hypothetical protein